MAFNSSGNNISLRYLNRKVRSPASDRALTRTAPATASSPINSPPGPSLRASDRKSPATDSVARRARLERSGLTAWSSRQKIFHNHEMLPRFIDGSSGKSPGAKIFLLLWVKDLFVKDFF